MAQLSHCTSVACAVPAAQAYALLADPGAIGSWALGCWDAERVDETTIRGTSLFDGSSGLVRVVPDERRLAVDYLVGADEDSLVHRISSRVVDGPALGRPEGSCVVTLLAWRTAGMDDARWAQLVAAHEAEILLLRGRLERSEMMTA